MKVGDPIKYRSLGVGIFPGVVVGLREDGSVDVELMPSQVVKNPITLTKVIVADKEGSCRRGQCFMAKP
jgi:hypothetical protein